MTDMFPANLQVLLEQHFFSVNETSLDNMQIIDSYCSSSFDPLAALRILPFAGFSYASDSCSFILTKTIMTKNRSQSLLSACML